MYEITPSQDQISFQPPAEDNTISMVPITNKPALSEETTDSRATKIAYGTDGNKPDIVSQLNARREDIMRQDAARQADVQFNKQKQKFILDYAQTRGGDVTPQELEAFSEMTREDFQHDPQTIFEKKFSQKFVRESVVNSAVESPTGLWGDAFKENPVATAQNMNIAANQMQKQQVIGTLLEDLKAEAHNRSYLGTAWDFGKSVLPFYSNWGMSSIISEVPGSIFQGNTMREKTSYLLSLPPEQMLPRLKLAVDYLKNRNINDAIALVEGLQKYTTNAQLFDNLVSATDIYAAAPLKTLGKLSSKVLTAQEKAITRLSAKTETIPVNATTIPPINEVVQDVVKSGIPIKKDFFEPVQLDLFHGDPRQGDLFAGARPGEAPSVSSTAGLPPGKLRSTYKPIAQQESESAVNELKLSKDPFTGRWTTASAKYRQQELPLDTGTAGQLSLDLQRPVAPTAPQIIDTTRIPPKVVEQQIALDGVLKGSSEVVSEPARVLSQTGNIVSASVYGAMQRLAKIAKAPFKIMDDLPSSHNPTEYFGKAVSLSAQRAIELAESASARQSKFDSAIDLSVRNNRLSDEAVKTGIEEASAKLHKNYDWRFNDGILDTVHIPAEFSRANVDTVVLRMGKMGSKDVFGSLEEAHTYARMSYNLASDEYKVYQQGSSYYIGISTPLRETSDKVMAANFTLKNATPVSMINTLIGKLRSTEDLLSNLHAGERKVAVHAQQTLRAAEKTIGEPLSKLSKTEKAELDAVLADGRDASIVIDGKVERGKWFETAAEFETAFMSRHKRMPTVEQIEANYVFRQMYDNEFVIRNAGVYRDMARQGAEQHALHVNGKPSAYFNGIEKDRLPWGSKDDATFLVYDVTGNKAPSVHWMQEAAKNEGKISKKEVEELIDKQGFKVIQTVSPSSKPLQGIFGDAIGNTPVNYIVTNGSTSKPLEWAQLTYRPGGHSIYPYEFYVKQPIIQVGHKGREFYYGDNTLWNFSSKAQADEWTNKLNQALKLYRDKDPGLNAYIASNLPMSKKEFNSLKDKFSFEHDFTVTQSGRSAFESSVDLEAKYPGTVNFHKSAHNPENFMDRAFVQDRDNVINTITGTGQITPAKQLDPLSALQKGLNQAIRSTWLNDYKIGAVNRWIEQFAPLFKDPTALRSNPLYHLYSPEWKKVADSERPALVAAQLEQKAIINFIGQQTEIGEAISSLQTKLMDTVYNKFGDKPVNYLADHHLAFIKDPASYFRAAAYHTQVGMFNWVQAIQQGSILGNVLFLSPKHGVQGTAAGIMMNWLSHTGEEAIINAMANKAVKFGWTPQEFKEMYAAYKGSGLYHVGSEAALRHDNFDNKLFQNMWGNFVDKGSMFFNAGERLGRGASFATSYREFRAANPGVNIGDREIRDILQRADLMTGNMTTASLNQYQKGILSIPLQFTTFFTRMAEQMLGHRLTTAEKARLFIGNSFLYGVPIATGVGGLPGAIAGVASGALNTGGDVFDKTQGAAIKGTAGALGAWPMYDDMKEYAMKNGINVSEGYWKVLADGVPATIASLISGKDVDIHAYGPGGTSFIRDILRTDKPFMDVIAGASGKVVGGLMESAYPIWRRTAQIFTGPEMGDFQGSDWVRLARNVSTLDLATRTYMAYKYGKFYTKNNIEVNANQLDNYDAALVALRINPESVDKTFTQMGAGKDIKNVQDRFEKLALESYRKGLQAAQEGDIAKQTEYWKDAKGYMQIGDFSPSDQSRILKRAWDSAGPLEDSIQKQFLKRSPTEEYINRFNQFYNNKVNQSK